MINNFELINNKTKQLLFDYINENIIYNKDYLQHVTDEDAIEFIKQSMKKVEEEEGKKEIKKEEIENRIDNNKDESEKKKEKEKNDNESENENDDESENENDEVIMKKEIIDDSEEEKKEEDKFGLIDIEDHISNLRMNKHRNIIPLNEVIQPKHISSQAVCRYCNMKNSEIKELGGKLAKLNV